MRSSRAAGAALTLLLVGATALSAGEVRSFLGEPVELGGSVEEDGRRWRAEPDLDLLESGPARLGVDWPEGGADVATRVSFETRSDGLFWRGRLEGGGEALVTLRGGRVAGFFFTPEGTWALEPRAGGEHELRRVELEGVEICDGALAPESRPGDEKPSAAARARRIPPANAARATPVIDVLVLHTRAALAAIGDRAAMEATAQSWVDVVNVVFEISEIDARVRLVHVTPTPTEPTPTATSSEVLIALANDRRVAALRDAEGADYVSLVYELPREGGTCGRAFVMTDPGPGFADSAVSVVRRNCGTPLTFVHELGHVLGSRHHPEEGGVAAFPWAYGHWDDREDRQTVMSTQLTCCPRLPVFSNPRVVTQGWLTGVRGERDNARAFAQTAPVVAAFGERACDLPPGDPDYCRECGPCGSGEGDCDGDAQCESGLECVKRAGREVGFSRRTDVCLPGTPADCPLPPGDPDYCTRCGPCERGEGDCDTNPECASGLTCMPNAGRLFGLGSDVDVCDVAPPASPDCAIVQDPGDPFYCASCGPCEVGEGNCTDDRECASFLTCVHGAGADHGYAADVGVCLFPEPAASCPVDLGARSYCRRCGPCAEGEGGCKKNKHCGPGLVCVRRAGPDFGFGKKIGVCLPG